MRKAGKITSDDFGLEHMEFVSIEEASEELTNAFVCGEKEDGVKACKFIEDVYDDPKEIFEVEPEYWGVRLKEIDAPANLIDVSGTSGREFEVGF